MLHTLLIMHVHKTNAVLAGFIRFSLYVLYMMHNMNTCVKLNLIFVIPLHINFCTLIIMSLHEIIAF